MTPTRSNVDDIESPRQTLYALAREEKVALNMQKELEKLLEEDDLHNSSSAQDEEKELAKCVAKVKNLKAQLQELSQFDDYDSLSLASSIDALEREIQRENSNDVSVTKEDEGGKLEEFERELHLAKSKELELTSKEQTISSKIADVENRQRLNKVGYDEDKLALNILKENMVQLKTELEELTLEKTTLNMELMSRLSKDDKCERGNGLFVEIVDWKAEITEKKYQIEIKIEEATVALEAKKAELQRKKESKICSDANFKLEELSESFWNNYTSRISELEDEISGLLYKFHLPACKFLDSCSNDFEWVRVYLNEASNKEAKMFLDCERLSHAILELTQVTDCLEKDIFYLNCELKNVPSVKKSVF